MNPLRITQARKHNLKNISLDIPRRKITGVTGVSGSGKSSLAVDTLYAEGQRRYMESLSSYARQFLKQVESAEVGSIENICPSVAVTGQASGFNARSTVGTMTEVDDFLRLLFARASDVICERCGASVKRHAREEVEEEVLKAFLDAKILIGVDVRDLLPEGVKADKELLNFSGFRKIYCGGAVVSLDEEGTCVGKDAVAVIDRFKVSADSRPRLARNIELCAKASRSKIISVIEENEKAAARYSLANNCPHCRTSYVLPDISFFSFNSAIGACGECSGFGRVISIDEKKVIPDENLSLSGKAIVPFSKGAYRWWQYALNTVCRKNNIPLDVPYKQLSEENRAIIWDGVKGRYRGIRGFFRKLERKKYKVQNRVLLARYRKYDVCASCGGTRLKKKAASYILDGRTIADLQSMQIDHLLKFLRSVTLSAAQKTIAGHVLEEIISRLDFLESVGLQYLSLMRLSRTLSGGELRRIQLAQSIGKALCDVLYVLDEPTIGLHVSDTKKLMQAVQELKNKGNTIVIIEHEKTVLRSCDHIVDLGPLAGEKGGHIVYQGSYEGLLRSKQSLTGRYFSGKNQISSRVETQKKKTRRDFIEIKGAAENNLKDIAVRFPLGEISAVAGVSGAGKSTLVRDVLYHFYLRNFKKEPVAEGKVLSVEGLEHFEDVYYIDQNRIASTPKGNVATFSGIMDRIRKAFASAPEAKKRKMTAGHFSFNSPKGQCPKCRGLGFETIDMQFLSDVSVACKFCEGSRFQSHVREILLQGKTILDVLKMTAGEVKDFLLSAGISAPECDWLNGFGLGYVCIGQALSTLSAGESQRLKLSDIVSQTKKGSRSLFLFDEPSVGLHMHDLSSIVSCMKKLKQEGHTLIIVEHNPDILRFCDYLVELGPCGGDKGGYLVSCGPLNKVLMKKKSSIKKALEERP